MFLVNGGGVLVILIIPLTIGWSIFWGLKAENVVYMKEFLILCIVFAVIIAGVLGDDFTSFVAIILIFSSPTIFPYGIWWIRQGE